MSTHHTPRSKYTTSTPNSSQSSHHRHHKNHSSDSKRFVNRTPSTQRQYNSQSDSSSRSTSNISSRVEYHYSISATMASTSQNAASSANSSTVSMHHYYYYQTPSHQMPEPEAWLMATPIDDDDLTFGGKPLSAWYEEDRRRFSLGEDSSRTLESDEDEEEERGRQRVRAHYDAPSPSHRQHHKAQHSGKSQDKH
ncbi:uncharacterized protein PpBr36_06191 [Pyricularia pennisetigena]|uniref:uncharacterized protein n=1 Tax=Pyricularia pennisetigena TaxID=1578925 RepID=UPI001152FFA1|nr:uncharacterized protein PpBr36_06191 [Pyricularia pennisetigena]TLS23363.1 hypothetical protein PpBr36_06191 [Pyricularia pennisetigena]